MKQLHCRNEKIKKFIRKGLKHFSHFAYKSMSTKSIKYKEFGCKVGDKMGKQTGL